MKRRAFLKLAALFTVSFSGLGSLLFSRKASGSESLEAQSLRIWSYYVPLTSYGGILDDGGEHALDRKAVFSELIKKTNRISGRRTDGTSNPSSFQIEDLQHADQYLRVHFWHDDNGTKRRSGHSLYVFKRYLEDLENGEKVFVATGMYQGHCHIVMIEPPA